MAYVDRLLNFAGIFLKSSFVKTAQDVKESDGDDSDEFDIEDDASGEEEADEPEDDSTSDESEDDSDDSFESGYGLSILDKLKETICPGDEPSRSGLKKVLSEIRNTHAAMAKGLVLPEQIENGFEEMFDDLEYIFIRYDNGDWSDIIDKRQPENDRNTILKTVEMAENLTDRYYNARETANNIKNFILSKTYFKVDEITVNGKKEKNKLHYLTFGALKAISESIDNLLINEMGINVKADPPTFKCEIRTQDRLNKHSFLSETRIIPIDVEMAKAFDGHDSDFFSYLDSIDQAEETKFDPEKHREEGVKQRGHRWGDDGGGIELSKDDEGGAMYSGSERSESSGFSMDPEGPAPTGFQELEISIGNSVSDADAEARLNEMYADDPEALADIKKDPQAYAEALAMFKVNILESTVGLTPRQRDAHNKAMREWRFRNPDLHAVYAKNYRKRINNWALNPGKLGEYAKKILNAMRRNSNNSAKLRREKEHLYKNVGRLNTAASTYRNKSNIFDDELKLYLNAVKKGVMTDADFAALGSLQNSSRYNALKEEEKNYLNKVYSDLVVNGALITEDKYNDGERAPDWLKEKAITFLNGKIGHFKDGAAELSEMKEHFENWLNNDFRPMYSMFIYTDEQKENTKEMIDSSLIVNRSPKKTEQNIYVIKRTLELSIDIETAAKMLAKQEGIPFEYALILLHQEQEKTKQGYYPYVEYDGKGSMVVNNRDAIDRIKAEVHNLNEQDPAKKKEVKEESELRQKNLHHRIQPMSRKLRDENQDMSEDEMYDELASELVTDEEEKEMIEAEKAAERAAARSAKKAAEEEARKARVDKMVAENPDGAEIKPGIVRRKKKTTTAGNWPMSAKPFSIPRIPDSYFW